jgi:hypothetical protein
MRDRQYVNAVLLLSEDHLVRKAWDERPARTLVIVAKRFGDSAMESQVRFKAAANFFAASGD